jgi:DNA primase large subunit
MPTLEQFRFAQRFPFSSAAKRIVKESRLSLDAVPEEIMNRAAVMISHAFREKEYTLNINSRELLEQEILAFPIAKILVSLMKNPYLYKSFSSMAGRSAFSYLGRSAEKKQLSLDLAKELGIEFELSEQKAFFVSVPLQRYLGIKFNDKSLKLVNQSLEKGQVFLNINLFCRFLGETVFLKVFSDLPVDTSSVPTLFKTFARQLSQQMSKAEFVEFNFKVEGKINPNAFPPCIALLYKKQLEGERLPHMARFFLATFLNAVGMPEKQILAVFKKSPDFNEKIASYQIRRIVGQKYAPASCEKIKSYGFCSNVECREKHPLGYYRRELRRLSKQKK